MLGESMSVWCPKTSKLEWLPNHTHKPRKPVTLGTMLKSAVEWGAGTIVCNDIVKNPEQKKGRSTQKTKPFHLVSQIF